MLYNTQLEPLRMKAYGREVQQMVDHALSLEDRAERQAYAQRIMMVMRTVAQVVNPTTKNCGTIWHNCRTINSKLTILAPSKPTKNNSVLRACPTLNSIRVCDTTVFWWKIS